MIEKRIFGIPGGGKTTYLSTVAIPDACECYGPENVMVTSFTRSGAKEIASKKSRKTGQSIPIPEENIGTLHSICFHALQAPKIIETDKKYIDMWNERYSDMQISGKHAKGDVFDEVGNDESVNNNAGDHLLNALNIKRNRMLQDKNLWHVDLRRFEKRWSEFKDEFQVVDFTDLIELCLRERPYAPNMPQAMFVDEAQDCSKLQISLVRSWAQNMDELVLVGDDDQAIFTFAGATQDAFLEPEIDDEQKTMLEQSYRCPVAVFNRARNMTDKLQRRQAKNYLPRRDSETGEFVEGLVRESSSNYKKSEAMIREAADIARAGKSVMILATCSYMLDDVKRELRNSGTPFENRYRRARKDWNPLYVSKKFGRDGTKAKASTVEMISSFLDKGDDGEFWTVQQFLDWAEHIKVGETGLKKKIGKAGILALKDAIARHDEGLHTTREVLSTLLTEAACERALSRDVTWLSDNLKADKGNSDHFEYIMKVLETHGKQALVEEPKILIGTVHSVKGGQSDVVYLFPDVSWQADAEMQQSLDGCDRAYRVFYVGMTRAYEELVICAPSVKYSRQSPRMFVPL